MTDQIKKAEDVGGFENGNMLGGEPKDINAKSDNDRLAGLIADPRLPEPIKGGSTDYSDERNTETAPADE
jgi:hypothetical protein